MGTGGNEMVSTTMNIYKYCKENDVKLSSLTSEKVRALNNLFLYDAEPLEEHINRILEGKYYEYGI